MNNFRIASSGKTRNVSLYSERNQQINNYSSSKDLFSLNKIKNNNQQKNQANAKEKSLNLSKNKLLQRTPTSHYIKHDNFINKKLNPQLNVEQTETKTERAKTASLAMQKIQICLNDNFSRPISSCVTSYRNRSLKIQRLADMLSALSKQVGQTRSQIFPLFETRRAIQPLLLDELFKIKQSHVKSMLGLAKTMRIKKEVCYERNQQIWNDINRLWEENQKIKESVFQLRIKIENVEFSMG